MQKIQTGVRKDPGRKSVRAWKDKTSKTEDNDEEKQAITSQKGKVAIKVVIKRGKFTQYIVKGSRESHQIGEFFSHFYDAMATASMYLVKKSKKFKIPL